MAFSAVTGTPKISVGAPLLGNSPILQAVSVITLNAVNSAAIMIGQIHWSDGGSHTVDTTSSSSLGWRTGAITFANGGTTVKVGLAALDTANGPPGRAANTTNVINFDVNASFTGGGGGITSNAWNESVPSTGTKTMAHGDLIAFAVQMTARGGADVITPHVCIPNENASGRPNVTSYNGTTYSNNGGVPNVVITASDGTVGYIYGGFVFLTPTTNQTWNNSSGTKEYGNVLSLPMPVTVNGIVAQLNPSAGTADCDFILYTDPLGSSPVAAATASLDANTDAGSGGTRYVEMLFATPVNLTAGQVFAVIAKPTTANNVVMPYKTYQSAAHQTSTTIGTDGYAVNRGASGAFAAQNSSKDRFAIGALISKMQDGVGTYPSSYAHA